MVVKSYRFIESVCVRSSAKASATVAFVLAFCLGGCADKPGENASLAGIPAFAGEGGSLITNAIPTGGVVASSSGGYDAVGSNDAGSTNAAASDAAGSTDAATDDRGVVSIAGNNGSSSSAGAGGNVAVDAGAGEPDGATEAVAGASGSVGSSHPNSWRIMLLGDSITETTCYPHLLWKKLRDTGHTNFDFVGTQINNQDCGVSNPDQDCEGHSSYRVTDLLPDGSHATELPQWCSQDNAEIALMHFGTNDAWSSVDTQKIIDAYSTVLAALRTANPKVIVFIAQLIGLIPINTPECPTCACPTICDEQVKKLNTVIPNWAKTNSTTESPIYVVDLYTGFDPTSDTRDGVHPNHTGAQKMADGWYNAIVARDLF